MKKVKLLFAVLVMTVMSTGIVHAQDEISDADLRKYALLSEVIEYMKKDISIELNEMIKAQEGMTGQRYKELAATKGDETKLTAIEAKDFEKKFLALTTDLKNDRTDAIKSVNSELATKMVGDKGRVYKKIRAELKTNEELKARYEAILSQVKGE